MKPVIIPTAIQPLLEDLKTFDSDTLQDFEQRHGKRLTQEAIRDGFIDVMNTVRLGDVVYLSLRGRRAMGFGSPYKPSEEVVLNHVAVRQGLKMLEAQGYQVKQEAQKHLWLLDRPDGAEVLVSISFDGMLARTVRTMLTRLEQSDKAYKSLPVLVIHPKPNQLMQTVNHEKFNGRVQVMLAPWGNKPTNIPTK
jgi:hypothetical protein